MVATLKLRSKRKRASDRFQGPLTAADVHPASSRYPILVPILEQIATGPWRIAGPSRRRRQRALQSPGLVPRRSRPDVVSSSAVRITGMALGLDELDDGVGRGR
jgi:hypothetical protein